MPNIKSAIKRVKTTHTAEERNISQKMKCVQQLRELNQLQKLTLITKLT